MTRKSARHNLQHLLQTMLECVAIAVDRTCAIHIIHITSSIYYNQVYDATDGGEVKMRLERSQPSMFNSGVRKWKPTG